MNACSRCKASVHARRVGHAVEQPRTSTVSGRVCAQQAAACTPPTIHMYNLCSTTRQFRGRRAFYPYPCPKQETEQASACAWPRRPPGAPPPAAARPRLRRRTARAPRRARSTGALRAARHQQPPLPAPVTAVRARATRRAPAVLSARALACSAAASATYRLSEYALELSPLNPPSRVVGFSHATGLGRAPPQASTASRAGGKGCALRTDGGAGARRALTGLPPGVARLAQTLHTSLDMQHQRWT